MGRQVKFSLEDDQALEWVAEKRVLVSPSLEILKIEQCTGKLDLIESVLND